MTNKQRGTLALAFVFATAASLGGCAMDGGTRGSDESSNGIAAGSYSLWPDTATPAQLSDPDSSAVELGVRVRADLAGTVTAIRFYKSAQNTGTHTGHLWTHGGRLLASVTFTNETASGWQTATLSSPVAIAANRTYVVSYHTNAGHYAGDNGYFATSARDNGPLHAPRDGAYGPNGVFRYGASAFPNQSWRASNYWVDLVFRPSGTADAGAGTDAGTDSGTSTGTDAGVDASVDSGTGTGTDASVDSGTVSDAGTSTDSGLTGWPSASNTGMRASPTSTVAGATYTQVGTATAPIVHQNIRYTDTVRVNAPAAWHVFRNCEFDNGSWYGLLVDEGTSHVTVEDSTFHNMETSISLAGSDHVVRRNNIYDTENGVTLYAVNALVEDNFVHNDAIGRSWGSDPHWDSIEVYGGSNVTIRHNELRLDGHTQTSLINIAPWGGPSVVDGVRIENNRLGGGGYQYTFDARQSTASNPIRNVVVTGNHYRSLAYYGIANIAGPVGYTWGSGNVWDCNGAPVSPGAWPPPC